MTPQTKTKTRRIRPWIAALLTFLGWGVGLYYAGKTRAAIRMAVASFAASLIIGAALVGYLYFAGPVNFGLIDSNGSDLGDAVQLLFSGLLAIGVWAFVAKQPREVEQSPPTRLLGYLGVWLAPLIGAVIIALVVRSSLVQPFHIPSGAMKPALTPGDFVAAEKWSYGYSRHSAGPMHFAFPEGRLFPRDPRRGDIVVFRNPKDANSDYVKRVVGLAGDEIRMIDGVLHINGAPVQKEIIGMRDANCDGLGKQAPAWRETLPNGVSYIVLECHGDMGRLDNVGPYNVPEGHFFAMGDNRDQSQDSRVYAMVGFIPFENLVGEMRIVRNADQ